MTLNKVVCTPKGSETVALTAQEETAFLAQQAEAQSAAATAALIAQAQTALDKSDITVLRCTENGIAVPADWATYRASLRTIVKNGSGTLPVAPAYPAGT